MNSTFKQSQDSGLLIGGENIIPIFGYEVKAIIFYESLNNYHFKTFELIRELWETINSTEAVEGAFQFEISGQRFHFIMGSETGDNQ